MPGSLAPIPVPGTTYYVDADRGDDRNDGLTRATAFETLAQGGRHLDPRGGDKLVLRGTFAESLRLRGINRRAFGQSNPARPTVIQSDFDGSGQPVRARIDGGLAGVQNYPFDKRGLPPGFGPGTGNYLERGISVTQCDHVTISGIDVIGIAGPGLRAQECSHLRVEHVVVEWTAESGMKFLNAGDPSAPRENDLTVAFCRINQANLGSWRDRSSGVGYNRNPEALTIVLYNGFNVIGNRISNTFQDGILFKLSRGGLIAHNHVEQSHLAGIYASESNGVLIWRNVVRRIGYYDPEDGSGLQIASPYIRSLTPGTSTPQGAAGIRIGNGDMNPAWQTGRAAGFRVFENVVYWTLKGGITVHNEWRKTGRRGWKLDDIWIYNNVAHRSCQGDISGPAAIPVDSGVTRSAVFNNIVSDSAKRGIHIWGDSSGFSATNVISHNLQYRNAEFGTPGLNPRFGNPSFVDPPATLEANADFHLLPGSPAVDAAFPIQLAPQFERLLDLGARQFNATPWQAGPGATR